MIERRQEIDSLHGLLKPHPVVGIIGARQVGKTTRARFFVKESQQKSSACYYNSLDNITALLDHARALSRPDLEFFRIWKIFWGC